MAEGGRKERIMKRTGYSSVLRAVLLLAVWITCSAAARGGEMEHPSVTVTVNPWFSPCNCELKPLGDPEKDPKATIAWQTGFEPPENDKPKKIKVGSVIEFRVSGSYNPNVTVPDDWTPLEGEDHISNGKTGRGERPVAERPAVLQVHGAGQPDGEGEVQKRNEFQVQLPAPETRGMSR
jgi:hypothetical protein